VDHDFPSIGRRILLLNARQTSRPPNKASWILLAFEDVTERRQLDRSLEVSEERFRRLVENAPDIVYTFSNQRGGIYYSSRVEQVLSYSAEYL